MIEFLNEILMPVNLPATIFMGLVVLYWLLVICGALGMDAFDFEPDFSPDADVDVDVGESLANSVFSFFYLREIPLMVGGSIFALLFWVITIVSNHYLNPDFAWWIMLAMLLPAVAISLIITKFTLMPIAPLFRKENAENDRRVLLIGRKAMVNTNELNDKFGEIKIDQQGPPLVINARNEKGQKLTKGNIVTIVGYDPENDVCIVELSKPEKL